MSQYYDIPHNFIQPVTPNNCILINSIRLEVTVLKRSDCLNRFHFISQNFQEMGTHNRLGKKAKCKLNDGWEADG